MKFPVAAWLGLLAASAMPVSAQIPCDRECLTGFVDEYLAAMVAHDASQARFYRTARFTENTVELPLTEGLWFTASSITGPRFYAADPDYGEVAFWGIVTERIQESAETHTPDTRPALLTLRLRIFNRRIYEAESLVVRGIDPAQISFPPAPNLAPSERIPRDKLIQSTHQYLDAVESGSLARVPFSGTCKQSLYSRADAKNQACLQRVETRAGQVTAIRPRRVQLIDEERGLSFGIHLYQYRNAGRDAVPRTMATAEMLFISRGEIQRIHSMELALPYGSTHGWELAQEPPSARPLSPLESCENRIMARGWESKSVEDQQQAAEERRAMRERPQVSPEKVAQQVKIDSLLLQRTRVKGDIERSSSERHKTMMQQGLDFLEAQLRDLGWTGEA